MYRAGQKEIDAIARVIRSGKVFRYHIGGECARFERRFARFLGVKHVWLTSSGTTALTAALAGLGLGPGDEVLVPACTYMATVVAVLGVGAIPVVVDIDDSITIDPDAVDEAVGPRTRAVIPVHMWGLPCDMNRILRVARRHKLRVIEDACQAVGGGYQGRRLGSLGHAGAFSFNYYKNMTCGEGGAVVTRDPEVAERARCLIDCCNYYWTAPRSTRTRMRRRAGVVPFIAAGARASEIEGAMLGAQLSRLPGMIRAMRRQKRRILRETERTGLIPIRANSPADECGSHVMFTLPTPAQTERFARLVKGMICGKTGRHVYTEWDPLFTHQGAHHPALNPFRLPQNRHCRMNYTKDMAARSLDILNRTVSVSTHPDYTRAQVTALIRRLKMAAEKVLS